MAISKKIDWKLENVSKCLIRSFAFPILIIYYSIMN